MRSFIITLSAAAWLLAVGPASAAFITVTQNTPGGLTFNAFYNAEETALLGQLEIPIEVSGTTCKPGTNPVGCEPVELFNPSSPATPRFAAEFPGATGDWTSTTLIESLGGDASVGLSQFSVFPGIETNPGDSFFIGEFSTVSLSGIEIFISASGAYSALDQDTNPIPLRDPRGTVLFAATPEPGALLLFGMVFGVVLLRRRMA